MVLLWRRIGDDVILRFQDFSKSQNLSAGSQGSKSLNQQLPYGVKERKYFGH